MTQPHGPQNCLWCGEDRGNSPSDDFCRELCEQAWQAARVGAAQRDRAPLRYKHPTTGIELSGWWCRDSHNADDFSWPWEPPIPGEDISDHVAQAHAEIEIEQRRAHLRVDDATPGFAVIVDEGTVPGALPALTSRNGDEPMQPIANGVRANLRAKIALGPLSRGAAAIVWPDGGLIEGKVGEGKTHPNQKGTSS